MFLEMLKLLFIILLYLEVKKKYLNYGLILILFLMMGFWLLIKI